MDTRKVENDDQFASVKWTADKVFGVILGSDFITDYNDNENVHVGDFNSVNAQEGFEELKGKNLKIYYSFDARQEFEDERVFQYTRETMYHETNGLKLRLATHKGRIYKVLLDRTYSKKRNKESQEQIVDMLSADFFLGNPVEQSDHYSKWITSYTEVIVECKKAAMPFASELRVQARAVIDIDDYPDYFDDRDWS
jgi:hypothetical protein